MSDNEWQGDDISDDKPGNSIRMMFHNVNGLSLRGNEGFDMFVNEQATLQIDLQGFTEHCLDTTKFQVTQTAQEITRQHYPGQVALQLNSSTDVAMNIYKPGGTGLLLLGDLVGRQEPRGRGGDQMGRWSYINLRRKNMAPVTIISAYQVCPRPTNLIGNTAYHQQRRALNIAGLSNLHPRRAFIQDLSNFIGTLRTKGHDVILGGDFNESLEDKRSGILQLATRHNLTDPFLIRFPDTRQFGTHSMGTKRIDYVFVTPGLLPSIRKVGYAPFYYSKQSDHRPIVIEVDKAIFFGRTSVQLQPAGNRVVKSRDRKAVTTFITKWFAEIQKRRGFSFQRQLEHDTITSNVAEMVDEIIGTSGDIAEQACKRRRPEFYSQQIVQHRIKVSLLRGHLNALRMGRDRTVQLKHRMQRAGMDFDLPPTQRLTNAMLRLARDDLQQSSRNSADIRQAELDARINEAASVGNKSKEKIVRSIRKIENNQRTFKTLQHMKQRATQSQQLDRVEIPDSWPTPDRPVTSLLELEDPKTCTQWRWITDPQEVEYYLLLRNRLHFGQADGTPFTRAPLNSDLDWSASTLAADQILEGSYQTTTTIPNCSDLLRACQARTELDDLPAELTPAEFKGKITTWREATTTSPSGRHLGRYKALFALGLPELDEDSSEVISLAAKQEAIVNLIVALINYCIRTTYVLDRWKTVVNVMIFKEQGNYKIHRLRVIHIYEADFNLILAVKWRQLLRRADSNNLIHEGQYGGRPGCEAQSLTLLEELKYDITYLTRRTLFNFDNDATSCYDRIIVPFASLVNRKYGLHGKVVSVHATALQQARFHLKTASGISDQYYSPCDNFPIHGTGQGSGNSPSIWLFISSTLFDVHTSLAQGATFVSPDGCHSIRFSMVGFVDDSTGSCNDFQPNSQATIDELLIKMECDARIWSNLLYCTGGKLELPKCSFHVLRFKFRPNGQPIPSLDVYDDRIHIQDRETNAWISIPSKRPFDPHFTLGHYKSPTSKAKTELKNLQAKAERIATLICISPINRAGAFLAYKTIYVPSIQYTLPQSFFSGQDLHTAQASSLHQVIAKCGYNRNTARALMFAPATYAGGGFLPWHLLQGEGQIKQFLKHWRTDSLVSRTLRIAVLWAQWQAGVELPILEDTVTDLNFLECRWIKSLREFLRTVKAKIYVDIPIVASPERQNDVHIMRYAIECGSFNKHDIQVINYCRLYLHVTTISELFNAQGTCIIPELFQCRREPWFSSSTYVTIQARPSEYQIRMKWQKLCRQWSLDTGQLAASMDLGKWTVPAHLLRRRRQTYYLPRTRRVYHWQHDCYWEYTRIPGKTDTYRKHCSTSWVPTSDCIPVDASFGRNKTERFLTVEMRLVFDDPPSRPGTERPRSFDHYIQSLPTWERSLLEGIRFLVPPNDIALRIFSSPKGTRLLVVSDGSLRHSTNTFGWVVGSNLNEVFAEHAGLGYGEPTSHRAEGYGMLSGALFIYHLYRFTSDVSLKPLNEYPLSFLADNSGLVSRVNNRQTFNSCYPNATLAPDWDVVEQIHLTLRKLDNKKTTIEWVRGHQDNTNNNLSVEAEYNVRADELAGGFQSIDNSAYRSPPLLPAERARLVINGSIIQGHYTKAIREAYTLPPYFEYLQKRHGWSQTQRADIDWISFNRAASNHIHPPVQLLKLVHHKLPTNSETAKTSQHQSDKCTYCDSRETFYHLMICNNPISASFRQDLLEAVQNYMQYNGATRIFQQSFCTCLEHCLLVPCLMAQDTIGHGEPSCIQQQKDLGSSSVLQGFLTKSWHCLYEHHDDDEYQPVKKPVDFFAGLIRVMWKVQLQFWSDHQKQSHLASAANPAWEDKLLRFKTHIRSLHAKRDQCLQSHREQYFYEDVDQFLRNANRYQMQQYLLHYEAAIHASIAEAKRHQLRSIFTFPGFSRDRRSTSRPPTLHHLRNPAGNTQHSTDNHGIHLMRKHTRWKPTIPTWNSIRQYFHPGPD